MKMIRMPALLFSSAPARSEKMGPGRGGAVVILVLALWLTPVVCLGLEINDDTIRQAIIRVLANDPVLSSQSVDIQVGRGVVSLDGRVVTLFARERATDLVKTVKGVRSVVNRLAIHPLRKRSDSELRRMVEATIEADPATSTYGVRVRVDEATVILEGEVDSHQQRQLAAEVTKTVPGVLEIDNRLKFPITPEPSDAEIRAAIKRRLIWDVWVNGDHIEVRVENGRVRLTGFVGSAAEAERARELAWVGGVREVDAGNLLMSWQKGDETHWQQMPENISDRDIRQAVLDTFLYDPRLVSFQPDVKVDRGVVTLSGEVGSLAAKRAAAADAKNTVGVSRVVNRLEVKMPGPVDDEELEKRIRRSFSKNRYVTAAQIKVEANRARVVLEGEVESIFEKQKAEEIAAGKKGVLGVENRIRVMGSGGAKNDIELQEDIEDELFWSPYVDADQVTVTVTDGTAYLSGRVDSPLEKQAAEDNAWEAGVKGVINLLEVKMVQ